MNDTVAEESDWGGAADGGVPQPLDLDAFLHAYCDEKLDPSLYTQAKLQESARVKRGGELRCRRSASWARLQHSIAPSASVARQLAGDSRSMSDSVHDASRSVSLEHSIVQGLHRSRSRSMARSHARGDPSHTPDRSPSPSHVAPHHALDGRRRRSRSRAEARPSPPLAGRGRSTPLQRALPPSRVVEVLRARSRSRSAARGRSLSRYTDLLDALPEAGSAGDAGWARPAARVALHDGVLSTLTGVPVVQQHAADMATQRQPFAGGASVSRSLSATKDFNRAVEALEKKRVPAGGSAQRGSMRSPSRSRSVLREVAGPVLAVIDEDSRVLVEVEEKRAESPRRVAGVRLPLGVDTAPAVRAAAQLAGLAATTLLSDTLTYTAQARIDVRTAAMDGLRAEASKPQAASTREHQLLRDMRAQVQRMREALMADLEDGREWEKVQAMAERAAQLEAEARARHEREKAAEAEARRVAEERAREEQAARRVAEEAAAAAAAATAAADAAATTAASTVVVPVVTQAHTVVTATSASAAEMQLPADRIEAACVMARNIQDSQALYMPHLEVPVANKTTPDRPDALAGAVPKNHIARDIWQRARASVSRLVATKVATEDTTARLDALLTEAQRNDTERPVVALPPQFHGGAYTLYACDVIAAVMLKKCDDIPVPTIDSSRHMAFAIARVAVYLFVRVPVFRQRLLGALYIATAAAVPVDSIIGVPAAAAAEITRMRKLLGLHAALLQEHAGDRDSRTDVRRGTNLNPHGMTVAWGYFARVLNARPSPVTLIQVHSLLIFAGHAMLAAFGRQFIKLLRALHEHVLPAADASIPAADKIAYGPLLSELRTMLTPPQATHGGYGRAAFAPQLAFRNPPEGSIFTMAASTEEG